MVNGYARGVFMFEKEEYAITIHARGSNYSNTVNLPDLFLAIGGNGGGHFHAAGMTTQGDFQTIYKKLIATMKKVLSKEAVG